MHTKNLFLAGLAAVAAISLSNAATISINFTAQSSDTYMQPSELAGAPGVAASNWNNYDYHVDKSGDPTSGPLLDSTGATTGASVTTEGGLGAWALPGHTIDDGHSRMWSGFFETNGDTASVTVTGIDMAEYAVYVYFDGDNGTNWRIGNYSIGDVSFTAEDSEDTNWGKGQNEAKVYQLPVPGGAGGNESWPIEAGAGTNSEGNYLVFDALVGESFTLEFAGGGAATGTRRAVINGIQIVPIPEPSTFLLGGIGLLALLRRRR